MAAVRWGAVAPGKRQEKEEGRGERGDHRGRKEKEEAIEEGGSASY